MTKVIKQKGQHNIEVWTQTFKGGAELIHVRSHNDCIYIETKNAREVAKALYDFEKEALNLLKTNHGYWYNGNGWIIADQPELGQVVLTDDEFLIYIKSLNPSK